MPDVPTISPEHQHLVARFFDDFDIAFGSFDGAVIAERYATPYLACRSDGSGESFDDAIAVAAYFQRIVDGYRDLGVRSCRHHSVEVSVADGVHTLARVTWVLDDQDSQPVISWHESYLLVQRDDHLLARASIDHPTEPLEVVRSVRDR